MCILRCGLHAEMGAGDPWPQEQGHSAGGDGPVPSLPLAREGRWKRPLLRRLLLPLASWWSVRPCHECPGQGRRVHGPRSACRFCLVLVSSMQQSRSCLLPFPVPGQAMHRAEDVGGGMTSSPHVEGPVSERGTEQEGQGHVPWAHAPGAPDCQEAAEASSLRLREKDGLPALPALWAVLAGRGTGLPTAGLLPGAVGLGPTGLGVGGGGEICTYRAA